MTDNFSNNNKPFLVAMPNYFNEITKIIGDKIRFICDDDVVLTVFISRSTPLSRLLELYTPLEVLDSLTSNSNSVSFSELSDHSQKTFCRTVKLVLDLATDKTSLIDPEQLKILLEKKRFDI